jgi:uncharacterized protein (DUF58 family)
MPRPTGRGFALLGLAAATYLAGRVVGTWELYLVGFAFLAAVIISWLLVLATGRRIRVTRKVTPERPVAGDEPEMSLHVENTSFFPGPHLTLRNQLAGLSSGDLELEVESLVPRGEKMVRTRVGRVNRGIHVLPAAQAVAEDPLGIASAVHRVSAPLPVTVYPRVAMLDSCVLYPEIGLKHDWGGRYGLPSPGASEFKGIRPHQPGEPLSHIDWKSTAKTGVLMLREMEEPAGADITLLLDGTAQQVVGEPPHSNFELAVRATGSIAHFALRAGRGVSLLRHEHSWRQTRLTADGGGRRSLMEALAEARPNASAPLANALRHLRVDARQVLRTQTVTVLSLSLDQQLVRTLIGLREVGMRLSFVYIVGASFTGVEARTGTGTGSSILPFLPPRDPARGSPLGPPQAATQLDPDPLAGVAARGQLPVESRALLLALSSAGIGCLTLGHGDDLFRALSFRGTGRKRARAL